jgi:hypothetical protein
MNSARRPLDPRKSNVAIDANSLDRPDTDRATAVDRLLSLAKDGKIQLIVPKGVRREFQDPRTPASVRETGLPQIFTLSVGLNSDEQRNRRIVETELQGNAMPGKHTDDADHLCEAAKYCGYFITHDVRILRKAGKLHDVLPPSLHVVTLAEFLEIYDDFEAGRRL